MNLPTVSHLTRLLTLLVLAGAVLLASTQEHAWATPAQHPFGQTIPTATPGKAATPAVTPPAATPAQGSVQQAVAPGIAATISTSDRTASVVLPANALRTSGTLVLRPMTSGKLPPASPGFKLLGKAIEALLFDAQGRLLAHPSFANPIQVCFTYTAADLATADSQPADLVVQSFDTSTSTWVALPTALDSSAHRVCGSVTHLALFALTVRSAAPGAPPQTGAHGTLLPGQLPDTGPQTPGLSTWLWVFIALGLVAAVAVALGIRQFKRNL
jgi:hypothetical protein